MVDLVGDDVPVGSSPEDYCDALELRFRSQGAAYVLKFDIWEGGRYVYTLFFGTKNALGCEKMKDAMWSAAGDGSYRFNGVHRNLSPLFDQDSTDYFPELVDDLVCKFGYDRWVTVEELADFLRGDGTLFRVAHLRGKALKPLQVQGRLEVRGQSRVGTFPPRKGVASSGPHHQDSGEAKIRESTAGVSRKPSSDGKARGSSSKHLCGLTAWNT